MVKKQEIDPMWMLCDNESTVGIFKNRDILVNLRKTNKPIRLKGIEGNTLGIMEEGELLGYGQVYYHPKVTANMLSFFNMTCRFKSIIFDNQKKNVFQVTRDDGSVMEFVPSVEGLYFYDFNKSIERKKIKEQEVVQNMMIVEAVDAIKRYYTKREIEEADQARRLCVIMGMPSSKLFELMIKKGKILNNPVTITDFQNAARIYGKDLRAIKGKTVKRKQEHVQIELNNTFVEKQVIILSVDLMNFLGVIFLITVSRDFRFITAMVLCDRKKKTIWSALKQVMSLYQSKGHKIEEVEFSEHENVVHMIPAENEFEMLWEEIEGSGTTVNITAKEEHIPEVERQNCVIKKWARGIVQTLPCDVMLRKIMWCTGSI